MDRPIKGNWVIFVLVLAVALLSMTTSLVLFDFFKPLKGVTAKASDGGQLSLSVLGIDPVPPWIDVVYPEVRTYTEQVVTLTYSVFDNNLDACWYSLDGGITNFSLPACGVNATGISSSEGANTWIVYVNDTANNTNSSSVSFIVDTSGGGSTSSGGGGGGRRIIFLPSNETVPEKFDIIPQEIDMDIIAGRSKIQKIIIVNTGDSDITINALISGISDIATLSKNEFFLEPGESDEVILNITAPDSGIYAGRVRFIYGDFVKDVSVLVNVRSAGILFDVSITVPPDYKIISRGDTLRTFISFLQVGPSFEVDVTVNYFVKNFDDTILFVDSERFSVFKNKSYVRDIHDLKLPPGDYMVGIEVIYPGGFATSSTRFTVVRSSFARILAISLIISLLVVMIILFVLKYKKAKKFLVIDRETKKR